MNNPAPQTPNTATPATDPVKAPHSPSSPLPGKDSTAPTAAKGNDDLMSQPGKSEPAKKS